MIHGPGDIRVERVPDPAILADDDAIVRVVASCVCGSDLWRYRGDDPVDGPRPMGHEFVGTVEAVGASVGKVRLGDFVVAPFSICDGTCRDCRRGG